MKQVQVSLVLLLAALAAPAQAMVKIDRFNVSVLALAYDTQIVPSESRVFLEDPEDPYGLPFTLIATAVKGVQFAGALQDKGGFFSDRSSVAVADYFGSSRVEAYARTEYFVGISTDTANTPLHVNFNFLGATAYAEAQYGIGFMEARYSAWIRASRELPRNLDELPAVWGFQEGTKLANRLNSGMSDKFAHYFIALADVKGIGLPAGSFEQGYRGFGSFGKQTREAFSGELDFGLLQPGETFYLSYSATTVAFGSLVPYTGFADVRLVDPFALQDPPTFLLEIEGLALPTAPVPEPAGLLLWPAGLLLLALRRRRWPIGSANQSIASQSNLPQAPGSLAYRSA